MNIKSEIKLEIPVLFTFKTVKGETVLRESNIPVDVECETEKIKLGVQHTVTTPEDEVYKRVEETCKHLVSTLDLNPPINLHLIWALFGLNLGLDYDDYVVEINYEVKKWATVIL